MSDEELMNQYKEGSEDSFMLLYEKYSSLVYGYIRKRLRASEADDFYQKVWRQLHEKRHLYRDQPFAPWFFVMIRNLLTDEYRALGKKLPEIPSEEEITDISEYLEALNPESRALVEKYYLDEKSYEELEKETGLSQTTLRQRLSRAMRSLKVKYEK